MATQLPSLDDDHRSEDHGGRRTRIAALLHEAKEPLSVEEMAGLAGVHVNTARFHLEALVEAGEATRQAEARGKPGRRRVLYMGALPNHESAQGYRLLANMLATVIAVNCQDPGEIMYQAGQEWGRFLTSRPMPFEVCDEDAIGTRILDKLDQFWFAAEQCAQPTQLLLHNCPFLDLARENPQVICQLHAGMINGSLEQLRSRQRIVELNPQVQPHLCRAILNALPRKHMTQVPLNTVHEDEPMPGNELS